MNVRLGQRIYAGEDYVRLRQSEKIVKARKRTNKSSNLLVLETLASLRQRR